jgi:uncharacterized protein YjbI with pentapeptide repeats
MNDLGQQPEGLAFEREKWEAEQRRLERDFQLRERELTLKQQEARRSRWWNPLFIAILGAAIAAGGSAYVSWENNKGSQNLEEFRAESARIFEVVKTGNPDIAAKNLSFLLDAGLIQNSVTVGNIRRYLEARKAGEGFALPVQPSLSSAWQEIAKAGRELDWHGQNLRNRRFVGANLQSKSLEDSDLTGADLTNADLSFADLRRANLTYSNLTGANFLDARLDDSRLAEARGLTQKQLDQASCGKPASLPPGLTKAPCPPIGGENILGNFR